MPSTVGKHGLTELEVSENHSRKIGNLGSNVIRISRPIEEQESIRRRLKKLLWLQ